MQKVVQIRQSDTRVHTRAAHMRVDQGHASKCVGMANKCTYACCE